MVTWLSKVGLSGDARGQRLLFLPGKASSSSRGAGSISLDLLFPSLQSKACCTLLVLVVFPDGTVEAFFAC